MNAEELDRYWQRIRTSQPDCPHWLAMSNAEFDKYMRDTARALSDLNEELSRPINHTQETGKP